MDGIIVINKPQGLTSHQVTQRLRRLYPGHKAGHSGTLDPMATGVLPVCLGQATRLTEYIIDLPKIYRAEITLGRTTTTEDATGETLEERKIPALTEAEVSSLLASFIGETVQIPPAYSAVKYKGKPLYHWTRKGEAAPRRERIVYIYRIELLKFTAEQSPQVTCIIECAKGTYIRTLAADLGRLIGCGAHLSGLTRLAVGPYRLEDATDLDELERMVEGEKGSGPIQGMDSAVAHIPALTLPPERVNDLRCGRIININELALEETALSSEQALFRIYGIDKRFKALASLNVSADGHYLKTVKYLER